MTPASPDFRGTDPMPEEGLEPTRPLRTKDFESFASAIPPLRRKPIFLALFRLLSFPR
jgi:hypothetical protein